MFKIRYEDTKQQERINTYLQAMFGKLREEQKGGIGVGQRWEQQLKQTKPHTCKNLPTMIPSLNGLHFDGRDPDNTIPLLIVPRCPDRASIALFQQTFQFVYVFLTCYNLKLYSKNISTNMTIYGIKHNSRTCIIY